MPAQYPDLSPTSSLQFATYTLHQNTTVYKTGVTLTCFENRLNLHSARHQRPQNPVQLDLDAQTTWPLGREAAVFHTSLATWTKVRIHFAEVKRFQIHAAIKFPALEFSKSAAGEIGELC